MQSSPNCGFGDNDHIIRGLIRFIEMTIGNLLLRMLYEMEEPPITNVDGIQTQRRFKFFYILNLSIGMPY